MALKLNVVIPTRVDSHITGKIAHYLVGYFGGFSSYMITGGWWNGEKVAYEDSNVYFSITGQPIELVREYALWIEKIIKSDTNEKEVLWYIEEVKQ